ncbi:TetR/AcrR family transcriptional regulator [Micromonospora olivasterospora]|nr:TetR/AcrR family transcriptional regulator [Micromonospora olivasterospora]
MTDNHETSSKGVGSTRERLIEAAMKAFSASGFDGVSGRQIERMAGVERGLLAYHFDTKQRLWETVVDLVLDRWTDEMFALHEALRDVSRSERARAMLMAYARYSMRNPEFFRILVLEGYVRTERSRHLAKHLWSGVQVFRETSHPDQTYSPAEVIQIFQIIGAAGAMSAMTAYLDDDLADRLTSPDVIEMFARTLATSSAPRSQRGNQDDLSSSLP